MGSLNLAALAACYITAATLGDAVNYAGGLMWQGRGPGRVGWDAAGCPAGLVCYISAAAHRGCRQLCMQVGGT
jgi:hypothetical protein